MSQAWKAHMAHVAATGHAVRHDLARHVLQLGQVAADQHHMGAQRGQLVRGAAANARAAAGDHHHLAGKQAGLENRLVIHAALS
jgi:hypothetical protein